MRYLRLPEGMASITVFEQTFGENGLVRGPDGEGVEDHIAREIMSHDPRITEVTADEANGDDYDSENQRHVSFMARVGTLDRTELFAVARALKVSMPATLTTDKMREVIVRKANETDPDQLPILLARSGVGGITDGITMLTPEHAADPNHGNDGLGNAVMKHGSTGTGATFSQSTVAPPAALPAPPGAGTITPAGMTQPPFNQLNTETGQPSHDSSIAPFPITVAPINPETGQPFAAGDPRIPITAQPIARQPDDGFHAAVDEHETKAAMAISEAADKLSDSTKA